MKNVTTEVIDVSYLTQPLSSEPPTMNRWFDIWLKTYKKGQLKPTTIDTYNTIYDRHIRDTVGSHRLDEFRPIHIQKLYNDFLLAGYTPKYLNTLHTMLNSMFNAALSNELISINPCSAVERPPIESVERHVLSREEQAILCTHIQQPRYCHIEPYVTTLLGTGLRIGELLALKWSDIHLASDTIDTSSSCKNPPEKVNYLTVRHTLVRVKNEGTPGSHYLLQTPKTKCSLRSIPLQDCVVNALMRQRQLQQKYRRRPTWMPSPDFDGLIFCGRNGQPHWRSTIVSNITTLVKSVNKEEKRMAELENRTPVHIDRILPHDLRHTFATRCLESGIPAKVVQHWLGHASIKITLDLYTHVSQDLSEQYMRILEASTLLSPTGYF